MSSSADMNRMGPAHHCRVGFMTSYTIIQHIRRNRSPIRAIASYYSGTVLIRCLLTTHTSSQIFLLSFPDTSIHTTAMLPLSFPRCGRVLSQTSRPRPLPHPGVLMLQIRLRRGYISPLHLMPDRLDSGRSPLDSRFEASSASRMRLRYRSPRRPSVKA